MKVENIETSSTTTETREAINKLDDNEDQENKPAVKKINYTKTSNHNSNKGTGIY